MTQSLRRLLWLPMGMECGGKTETKNTGQEAIVAIQATDDGVLDWKDSVNREKRANMAYFFN